MNSFKGFFTIFCFFRLYTYKNNKGNFEELLTKFIMDDEVSLVLSSLED